MYLQFGNWSWFMNFKLKLSLWKNLWILIWMAFHQLVVFLSATVMWYHSLTDFGVTQLLRYVSRKSYVVLISTNTNTGSNNVLFGILTWVEVFTLVRGIYIGQGIYNGRTFSLVIDQVCRKFINHTKFVKSSSFIYNIYKMQ